MNINKEYYIPPKTQIIFVSDLNVKDYIGGAELTTEAIMDKSPYNCFFLHSTSLTEELVRKNKDKYWIFVNWTGVPIEGIIEVIQSSKYSIIEADFKLCRHRSPQLHELIEKKLCDCHIQKQGKFVEAFYLRAQNVFFMSQKQKEIYMNLLPRLKTAENKMIVQGSTWSDEHLDKLFELRNTLKNDKWAVLSGSTWLKNTKATEEYCIKNKLTYDLIGGLPYENFIKKLSEYKGLISIPISYDTCPRLVVEAKIMGLDLILNDFVQHKDEPWFVTEDITSTIDYLRTAKSRFWNIIKI